MQELEETLNDDTEMAAMYLGRRAEKEQQAQAGGIPPTSSSRLASLAEALQTSEEDPVSATAGAEGRGHDAELPVDNQTGDTAEQVRWPFQWHTS